MSHRLQGKKVVVALTGGIACYKGAELVRLLTKGGADVRVIMTHGAAEFITRLTLQTLSGRPVNTDTFDLTQESEIGHIRLADTADAVIVAPATANLIAKMAVGIADDLLTTVLLATRAPVLIAPAMNVHMYENAVVQANLAALRQRGHRVINPGSGGLACGYEGAGRLPEPPVLLAEIERAVGGNDFAGERVLVTAGPTREPIDPVRFVSSRSSGRMGYALATAAWLRGADVVLVSGPCSLPDPRGVRTVRVGTAAEMHAAVAKEFAAATTVLMAAAVSDYRPAQPAEQKVKKGPGKLALELHRTVDILADLGRRKGKKMLVGFAAETEDVLAHADEKRRRKNLDLIVANDVTRADAGFEAETNAVTLIDERGREDVPLLSKDEVADLILDRVVALRAARKPKRAARPSRSAAATRRRG